MTGRILTLSALLALSLALGGCDKCGKWFQSSAGFDLQACTETPPAR